MDRDGVPVYVDFFFLTRYNTELHAIPGELTLQHTFPPTSHGTAAGWDPTGEQLRLVYFPLTGHGTRPTLSLEPSSGLHFAIDLRPLNYLALPMALNSSPPTCFQVHKATASWRFSQVPSSHLPGRAGRSLPGWPLLTAKVHGGQDPPIICLH